MRKEHAHDTDAEKIKVSERKIKKTKKRESECLL